MFAHTNSGHQALLAAIDRAGSQVALAKICRCAASNIWLLVKRKSPLPVRFVLEVERELGIPRGVLRPDVYPPEQATAA